MMNMKQWLNDLLRAEEKLPLPILSFPSCSLLGCDVQQLTADAEKQARGMQLVAQRNRSAAAVSMMDLSVEAEAFGSPIRISKDEVPTVVGAIAATPEEAEALQVPAVGAGRTGIYVEAIRRARAYITDRPVFAGVIGPFSLTGRLVDVNEAFIKCYEDPDTMHLILGKATAFLIAYARAFKAAGANGIVMAEPLAGLLSPALTEEFSEPYVRQIVEAVQDDTFIVIYHNCGDCVLRQVDSILRTGAAAYHFGNAIRLADMLEKVPEDTIVMGNVDPAAQFRNGTPESVAAETRRIMGECCGHRNFVISSGCDIPPSSPWENIDAFFRAVTEFYSAKE